MNRKSKISTIIAFVCVVVLAAAQLPALANNYADTDFKFYLRSSTIFEDYTEGRRKEDDSSGWAYVSSTTNPVVLALAGCNSTNDVPREIYDQGYVFYAGTGRYLINFVYEDGFPYACLAGRTTNGQATITEGVWSPDSI